MAIQRFPTAPFSRPRSSSGAESPAPISPPWPALQRV
jgi:hypothetical protein